MQFCQVFWALRDACQAVLRELPSTIADDEAFLASMDKEDECMHLAVRWRLGYKRCGLSECAQGRCS